MLYEEEKVYVKFQVNRRVAHNHCIVRLLFLICMKMFPYTIILNKKQLKIFVVLVIHQKFVCIVACYFRSVVVQHREELERLQESARFSLLLFVWWLM